MILSKDGYLLCIGADRVTIVVQVLNRPLTPKDWMDMADALCDVALDAIEKRKEGREQ